MKRQLIKAIKGESGQALPIVLVLLGLGGLLIAPSLNYASTSLNSGRVVEKNVSGLYAADAGIEHALWSIKNDAVPAHQPYPLPEENINQMQVAVDILEDEETYALYKGEVILTRDKWDSLAVDGEMGEWDPVAEAYPYTITVTWQPEADAQKIHLYEVGARLPVGYRYQTGSADSFGGNLSTNEPDDPVEQDQAGAHMLNWTLGSPPPYVSDPDLPDPKPKRTQTFYITGEGELKGDYTWVEGVPNSIWKVGEVIGKLYGITATARPEGGEITAKVTADAIVNETEGEIEIRVILWQINPQQ